MQAILLKNLSLANEPFDELHQGPNQRFLCAAEDEPVCLLWKKRVPNKNKRAYLKRIKPHIAHILFKRSINLSS